MRYGNLVDGTPEEIKNFIELSGQDMKDFIQIPETPISAWFFYITAFLFVSDILLVFYIPKIKAVLSLIGVAIAVLIVVVTQLRFEKWLASSIAAIGLAILLLLARVDLNYISLFKALLKSSHE